MSSFADQFKSEIARKEVRAETEALKMANAQYRADIAALKRSTAVIECALAVHRQRGERLCISRSYRSDFIIAGAALSIGRICQPAQKIGAFLPPTWTS